MKESLVAGKMKGVRIVVLAAICTRLALTASLSHEEETGSDKREVTGVDVHQYLRKFGYADDDGGNRGTPLDEASLKASLREFQIYNHLPVTGMLDAPTLEKMKQPRCGMKDIIRRKGRDGLAMSNPSNYYAPGYKWKKTKITWNPERYSSKLGRNDQWWAINNGFKYWEDVTPLKFQYNGGSVIPDINIKFARRNHGDGVGNSFDGKGGVLAHAFYPGNSPISGDTHFDEDEKWTVKSNDGTNLEIVAAHEFGHALGLGHSNVRGSLMAPFYQGFDPDFKLHQDDIRGIQRLYGKNTRTETEPTTLKTTTTPTPSTAKITTPTPSTAKVTTTTTTVSTTSTTVEPHRPSFCDMKFDAVVLGPDGKTYIMRHSKVYTVGVNGLEGIKDTRDIYPGAPVRIGAAVFVPERKQTFFFKGSRVWRYTGFSLDEGYPKYIGRFPEYPHAAITMRAYRGARSQIYIFGKDQFWEWNHDTSKIVGGYPQPINRYWRGVPDGVEAAVTWLDNYIYFFKGKKYRKFDSYYRTAMRTKDTAPAWFGGACGTAEKFTMR